MMSLENCSLESLNLFYEEGSVDGYGYEIIETGFEISPEEFLKFAELDLTAEYKHHLVNSLSNTKRAIDSQLDSLLIGFGLSEKSKRWRFPKKIEFLNSVGIISPRILNKINKKRNLLEHEYKNPSKEEVEDALDVALLFVSYTNKYLNPALVSCDLLTSGLDIKVDLDWKNCKLIFHVRQQGKSKIDCIDEEITVDQIEYNLYLAFFLSLYNYVNL